MAVTLRDYCKYCGRYSKMTTLYSQTCKYCKHKRNKEEIDIGGFVVLVLFVIMMILPFVLLSQIDVNALKFWELMVILGSLS